VGEGEKVLGGGRKEPRKIPKDGVMNIIIKEKRGGGGGGGRKNGKSPFIVEIPTFKKEGKKNDVPVEGPLERGIRRRLQNMKNPTIRAREEVAAIKGTERLQERKGTNKRK